MGTGDVWTRCVWLEVTHSVTLLLRYSRCLREAGLGPAYHLHLAQAEIITAYKDNSQHFVLQRNDRTPRRRGAIPPMPWRKHTMHQQPALQCPASYTGISDQHPMLGHGGGGGAGAGGRRSARSAPSGALKMPHQRTTNSADVCTPHCRVTKDPLHHCHAHPHPPRRWPHSLMPAHAHARSMQTTMKGNS